MGSFEIAFQVALLLVSIVLTHYFPTLIAMYSERSFTRSLNGAWTGYYKHHDDGSEWIEEKVSIDAKGRKIRITSNSNPKNLNYEATGELVNDHFVVGEWEALSEKSRENGVISLILPKNGKYMYGTWSGFTKKGKYFYSPCVYVEDKASIPEIVDIIGELFDDFSKLNLSENRSSTHSGSR